jgi:hypothetical protein
MTRYFAIVGCPFVVPLAEITEPDMAVIRKASNPKLAAVPVYFCRGVGVWPDPTSDCIVVKTVAPETLE